MTAGAMNLTRPLCLFLLLATLGCASAAAGCQTKDGLTVFQVLERHDEASTFAALIRQAGLVKYFNNKALQLTLLVPVDYAFGNLLPVGKGFFDVFPGVEIPRTIVNFHVSVPAIPPSKMGDGTGLRLALNDSKNKPMTVNITSSADPFKPLIATGPVNSANMIKTPRKGLGFVACNSVIYFIDEVLIPGEKIIPADTPRVSVATAEKVSKTFTPLLTPRKPEGDEPAGK